MGKKKVTGGQKSNNADGKSDTVTSPPDKHSNKKSKKNTQKAAATPLTPGSVFVGIFLSALVVLGAVIVTNKDVQNYLVSITPMGSSPLEYILTNNEGSHSADKNSARTHQDDMVHGEETIQSTEDNTVHNNFDQTNNKHTLDKVTNKDKSDLESSEKTIQSKADDSEKETQTGNSQHNSDQAENTTNEGKENTLEKQKKKVKRKDYVKHEITNKADFKIRKKLDAAEELREEGKLKEALDKFDSILVSHPESPRALYGMALVTDSMASKQRSNKLLEKAIDVMYKALRLSDTPRQLKYEIGTKLADRQSFRGWDGKAAGTWKYLMEQYPEEITFQQKYGTCFLILGKNERAREVFKKILDSHPDDSYSLLHLGFILKSVDTNYKEAISLLQRGIDLDTEGKTEGKFFYHLGDSYLRVNQSDKAAEVYRMGAERGLFLSQYQRSLYNADTPLTGRPWWTPEQTMYTEHLKTLEKYWKTIREEGLTQLNTKTGSFLPEEENLRETGDWKQFTLFQRGRKNEENCKKVPKTCALLDQIPDATGCSRGQIKYSVMHPGVHVWPHTGPTNCRLRAHLGLKVPPGPRIRVGNDTRTWTEGKFIIFDDSFEHEVWHDGSELRLVLIVDFWHPELTEHQKRTLSPI